MPTPSPGVGTPAFLGEASLTFKPPTSLFPLQLQEDLEVSLIQRAYKFSDTHPVAPNTALASTESKHLLSHAPSSLSISTRGETQKEDCSRDKQQTENVKHLPQDDMTTSFGGPSCALQSALLWGSLETQSGTGRFSLLLELPHDLLSCGNTSHPGKPGPGSTKWAMLLTECFLLSWPLATMANTTRYRKLFRLVGMTPQKLTQ